MGSHVANCKGRLIAVATIAAILLATWLVVGPAFAQSTPEVRITSDGDVTEGADATFTLTASPAPASDLYVDVTVSEGPMSGMVTAPNQTGYYSVVIETGKTTATLAVATDDDKTDEPRGVIMATLTAPGNNAGYTTASHAKYATVIVADNDVATHDRGSSDGVTVTMSADHAQVWRQGGKTTLQFTLSRALKTGESITLPFTVQGGSPSVHYDLTNLQGTGVTRPSTRRLVLTTGATGATLTSTVAAPTPTAPSPSPMEVASPIRPHHRASSAASC